MVSDADYFRDLGSDLGVTSRVELERRGGVVLNQGGLFMRLWAQGFQRLDLQGLEEYQRLPELQMSYGTKLIGPLEGSIGARITEFDRDTEGLNGIAAITGRRTHIEPQLRLPLVKTWGFMTLTGGYRHTDYDLKQDNSALGVQLVDDNPERGIGFGSLDSGLFFERDINWFNTGLIQTLEPRIYYLYQEFEDQSALPVFDASELTFSYSQLYRSNRFSGLDRFSNANQASAGLTTRFINESSGVELFRFSVGEILYFEDRRVTLAGAPPTEARQDASALAAEMSARLFGDWNLTGNVVWDQYDNEVEEGGGSLQYRRDNRHIFNVGFRKQRRQNIEQTDVALYWPLTRNISVLGRWNYDLVSNRTIEGFGGLEYSDCCLQVRLIARRFLDARSSTNFAAVEADEGVFLQIVFKGLAGFGTKVESVLERGIRGYRAPQARDFLSN
jgi:LPS-assembly protein